MKKELNSYVEKQAEKAENLSFCSGIKLLHIRNSVEELLSLIGRGGIFEEYTLHNIGHIEEMLKIVEWLVPDETKREMTYAEWLMLTLAVYFHDLGMLVTRDEYENRNGSDYSIYKNKIMNSVPLEYKEYAELDEHFLYQEFVREHHAKRIRLWLENKEDANFGDDSTVRKEVTQILSNLDSMFRTDLAMICESHHKDDIDNFSKYKTNVLYGTDDNEKVNLNYIAIILRVADLLHITKDRTPSVSRRVINVSNPVSVIEWEKQKAVKAIKPKQPRNEEGNIDNSLEKNIIEVTAYFDGAETAEAYFGLSSYLQYVKQELMKCFEIVEKAKKIEGTEKYKFPWNNIDEEQIIAVGFEPKKLQFTIAQDNILRLLVGHTLYNDSSVVVRELVQNGIDAVRLQKLKDEHGKRIVTEGKILVDWNDKKRELAFWDNGTGMTIQDVEKYLLRVGASKYREDSIMKEYPNFTSISHFGIGILTCFMIADDIEIITCSEEQEEASIINLRKVNGSYLLRKINKEELNSIIKKHGTLIKLYVRSDVEMTEIERDLRKWIVMPEVPVYLKKGDTKEIRIGYDTPKEIIKKYLKDVGCSVDGKKIDVREMTHGNVTMAYAVRYIPYLSDWSLMYVERTRKQNARSNLAIGTCIEGIRVEFTTPGYRNASVVAIANIKNSKYQTNVARTAIELDANKEILSDIYDVFVEYIQGQMDKLEKEKYSKTWAISEGSYLMSPLINSNYNSLRIEPMDEGILMQRLANLKCIVLESEGKREIISVEDLANKEEISIYDCKMTQAAEYLLKEIQSEATLKNLLRVVCSEENFLDDVRHVVCNFDERNILHQYALRNKSVTQIDVNRKQRRIHLVYSDQSGIWDTFDLKGAENVKKVHIPKDNFKIDGLEYEVGVKTINGTYIKSDSELCQYIKRTIKCFQEDDTEENKALLDIFLMCVFGTNTLENIYDNENDSDSLFKNFLQKQYRRIDNNLLSKLWSKVNMDEFTKIILTNSYSFYSISNWSREKEGL